LAGNNPNFYAYIKDNNIRIDVFGLSDCMSVSELRKARKVHDLSQDKIDSLKKLSDAELLNALIIQRLESLLQ
jgi:hypothetical protein